MLINNPLVPLSELLNQLSALGREGASTSSRCAQWKRPKKS